MANIMTAKMAIGKMGEPTEYMEGSVFACQINFFNNENGGREDETSFDIDCTQPNWRDELLICWEEFCVENNLPEDCVIDAWATTIDDDYYEND